MNGQNEMTTNEIVSRLNEINRQLSDGVANQIEEENLRKERDDLYSKIFKTEEKKEEEYKNPLENEYEITPANDDYLYDYFDDEYEITEPITQNNSELEEIERELNEIREKIRDAINNNFNYVTHEDLDRWQRKIGELEKRKSELTNETKEIKNDNVYFEEAKNIIDKINKLEEELNQYYSGELTDSFGVRSSEINRELASLREKLNKIKSKLTPKEQEELQNYINRKGKEDKKELPPIGENDKKNDNQEILALPPGRDKTPEPPKNNEPLALPSGEKLALPPGKKVTGVKKWIKDHKKLLITIGIATLATLAVINIVPVVMAANAAAWHVAGAATQAGLHSANMVLGDALAKFYVGSHAYFGAAGIHTFGGIELAKVAAGSAVQVAASVVGIKALKNLKTGSNKYKEIKNEIKSLNKKLKKEASIDADEYYNKFNYLRSKINYCRENYELTEKEADNLYKRIDKLEDYMEREFPAQKENKETTNKSPYHKISDVAKESEPKHNTTDKFEEIEDNVERRVNEFIDKEEDTSRLAKMKETLEKGKAKYEDSVRRLKERAEEIRKERGIYDTLDDVAEGRSR